MCKCHWTLPISLLSLRDCWSSEGPVPQPSRMPTLHLLPQSWGNESGDRGSTWATLLSLSSACQTPLTLAHHGMTFWEESTICVRGLPPQTAPGSCISAGKAQCHDWGGYLPFFSVPAWSQNDILSHNCCFRHSTGPINLTQIRNIYWSCHPHI